MSEKFGIYWIQGQIDGEWSNLQRCDDHDDAVAKMGPLANDRRYQELRLVLAQVQKGKIEYTTLVTVRDGEIVSDSSLLETFAPSAKEPPREAPVVAEPSKRRSWHIPLLALILIAAIGGGLAIANRYPNFALAIYESLTRNDIHVFMLLPIVGRAVECWRSGAMPPRFRWFPRNLWRDGGYDRAKRRCAQPPSGGATIRTPWRRRSA